MSIVRSGYFDETAPGNGFGSTIVSQGIAASLFYILYKDAKNLQERRRDSSKNVKSIQLETYGGFSNYDVVYIKNRGRINFAK